MLLQQDDEFHRFCVIAAVSTLTFFIGLAIPIAIGVCMVSASYLWMGFWYLFSW